MRTYHRHASLSTGSWLLQQCCYSYVIEASFCWKGGVNEGNSLLVKYVDLPASPTFISLIIILLHCETPKTLFENGKRINSLASALCCVNRIFYLAWPAPNVKTIYVSVHLVTMILDDVFPQQVTHSYYYSTSESKTALKSLSCAECTGWSVRSWQIHKWLVYVFQSLNLNVIIPCRCLLHSLHCGGGCPYQDFMGFVFLDRERE